MSVRPILLAVALVLVTMTAADSQPSAPPPATACTIVYHFKTPRHLPLDTSRLAVHCAPAQRTGVDQAAARAGLSISSALPPRNWHMAEVAAPPSGAHGVANRITTFTAEAPGVFVSPVFLDADGQPMFATQDLLVGFIDTITEQAAALQLQVTIPGTLIDWNFAGMPGVARYRCDTQNGFDVLAAAAALAPLGIVRFAEPDMNFRGRTGEHIPDDPLFGDCWGLHNTGQGGGTVDIDMDAPEAWDVNTGDPGVIVVVLDDGVQQDHPDLNQVPGIDTTDDPASTGDGGPVNEFDNHGTAVAGCISATIDNNLGAVGVAPDCRVAGARCHIGLPGGSINVQQSWVVTSLGWAHSIDARVTNNSNSYGSQWSIIDALYELTHDAGIAHFAAAGNGYGEPIRYPSSLPTVNSVAAVDRHGVLADFSNFGAGLGFSAPGEDIWTTDRTGPHGYADGDYASVDGTSFASPYAAGVMALFLSRHPWVQTADVAEHNLRGSCMDLGGVGYDTTFGWGLVNAFAAVGAWAQEAKWLAGDTDDDDQFGYRVAMSGDTFLVGAPRNQNYGSPSGSAYIFVRDGETWTEQAKLIASDGASDDYFGRAVALSGDTALVGAPYDDDSGTDSGSAYIFVRDGETWTEQAKLTAPDGAAYDRFGHAVALSGDTALVGGQRHDDGGFDSVYVFVRDGETWTQQAKLTAPDGSGGDGFGYAVALSGDTALIGAYHYDGFGSHTGSAYVFVREGETWTEQARLIAADCPSSLGLGIAVALSEDTALVSARYDHDIDVESGAAYVFVRDGETWTEQAKLTPSNSTGEDYYGHTAVALSGDTALVGAFADDHYGPWVGAAYVFARHGETWTEQARLDASDGEDYDRFGHAVALSGNTAVIGAFGDSDYGTITGSAYVFRGDLSWYADPICPGDLDGNLEVNMSDLGILLAAFEVDDGGDTDGDGDTDLSDLGLVLANWGLVCE